MSGSFSVRGCTAQPFSTALPTRSSSFSGTEVKAVWGKRPGYLFKVKSLRIRESCITQCRVSEGAVHAWGTLAGNGEQPLSGCSSPAPGTTAVGVLRQKRLGEMLSIFSHSSRGPFLVLLTAGEIESGEIPFWGCISFCNFSVLNV